MNKFLFFANVRGANYLLGTWICMFFLFAKLYFHVFNSHFYFLFSARFLHKLCLRYYIMSDFLACTLRSVLWVLGFYYFFNPLLSCWNDWSSKQWLDSGHAVVKSRTHVWLQSPHVLPRSPIEKTKDLIKHTRGQIGNEVCGEWEPCQKRKQISTVAALLRYILWPVRPTVWSLFIPRPDFWLSC